MYFDYQQLCERWTSLLSFMSHDREQHSSRIQSPSPQLSPAACNAEDCSKPPPSGMFLPTATVQSKPLLTGTLTSAEFSGQEDSTTPIMMPGTIRHNCLHFSHQESSSTIWSIRGSLIYPHWEHYHNVNNPNTDSQEMYFLLSKDSSC